MTLLVVFFIFCLKCELIYIGETASSIKQGILEHLRNIKKFRIKWRNIEYSLINVNKFRELSIYLNKLGHTLNDFKFCVFETNIINNEIRKSIETDFDIEISFDHKEI